jgi:hypothetical protein
MGKSGKSENPENRGSDKIYRRVVRVGLNHVVGYGIMQFLYYSREFLAENDIVNAGGAAAVCLNKWLAGLFHDK